MGTDRALRQAVFRSYQTTEPAGFLSHLQCSSVCSFRWEACDGGAPYLTRRTLTRIYGDIKSIGPCYVLHKRQDNSTLLYRKIRRRQPKGHPFDTIALKVSSQSSVEIIAHLDNTTFFYLSWNHHSGGKKLKKKKQSRLLMDPTEPN